MNNIEAEAWIHGTDRWVQEGRAMGVTGLKR